VGNYYEKTGTGAVTKYYFAGATRLAVRTNGTLSYLLGDHLGSSSVTTNANGVKTASVLYKAFGETRYSSGNLGTDYKFTGQREQAELGLYFYGARWYDSSLGRFTSPDTMIPSAQGVQAWDRYAYVNNNPVRYNDPTGHMIDQGDEGGCTTEFDCDPRLYTYTLAGIEMMSPSILGVKINYRFPLAVAVRKKFGDDHVSEGRAKLYPEEAEEFGVDPNTPEGVLDGMQQRISTRLEACTGCSETDKFIVAALGADYNFSAENVETATADRFASDAGSATIDWALYFVKESGGSYDKYMDLIKIFTSNVQELQSQGYYVPSTVDFGYIQNLLP